MKSKGFYRKGRKGPVIPVIGKTKTFYHKGHEETQRRRSEQIGSGDRRDRA